MVLLILISGAFTWKAVGDSESNYGALRHNTRGAVLCPKRKARCGIALRFPQFMVGDAAGRAKVTSDEPRLKALVDEALKSMPRTTSAPRRGQAAGTHRDL